MEKFREFLKSPPGKILATVLVLLGIGYLTWNIAGFGQTNLSSVTSGRMFICSETGKTFQHSISIGETIPVESPYTGELTGYEAETCYWTADGQTKQEPTYVMLKSAAGIDEPTFCPDCDRLVVGLNPAPADASRTPPTRAEYENRSQSR